MNEASALAVNCHTSLCVLSHPKGERKTEKQVVTACDGQLVGTQIGREMSMGAVCRGDVWVQLSVDVCRGNVRRKLSGGMFGWENVLGDVAGMCGSRAGVSTCSSYDSYHPG